MNEWKKRSEETQTLRVGCSKAEPKKNLPAQTPFPGAQDGQKLISCRWSLPLLTNPVWWGSMYAILSYRGNRPIHTHSHTHMHTHPQTDRTDYKTLRRSIERSVINEWMNLHPQWQGTSQALYSLLSTSSARHFANFSRTVTLLAHACRYHCDVTTTFRLQFNRRSTLFNWKYATALRPFDDIRYDRIGTAA